MCRIEYVEVVLSCCRSSHRLDTREDDTEPILIATQTLLQLNVAGHYRGRVASALGTTTSLMALLGMLVSSMLGDRAGAVGLLDCPGTLTASALALPRRDAPALRFVGKSLLQHVHLRAVEH